MEKQNKNTMLSGYLQEVRLLVREGRFDEIESLVREAADIVKEIRG